MSGLAIPQATDYHWSGANQRRFLEALAEKGVVSLAAKLVNMSAQAAYKFRQRAEGRVFALGWLAAILVSRDRLFDELMQRAFEGQVEELIRDPENNRLTRRRIENGHSRAMLGHLNQMLADAGKNEPLLPAARIVAGDFENYLGLVEREARGSEVGQFLAANDGALYRAFDCKLAQKSAGFEVGAEVRKSAQLSGPPEFDGSPEAHAADLSVWLAEDIGEWRTDFPPPAGFEGREWGEYGDAEYKRELTDAEAAVQNARLSIEDRPFIAAAHAAREAWFVTGPQEEAEMATLAAAAEAERAEEEAIEARIMERQALQTPVLEVKTLEMKSLEMKSLGRKVAAEAVAEAHEAEPAGEAVHEEEPRGPVILPSAPGNRIITMPYKPRPLFGIYGERLPSWDMR